MSHITRTLTHPPKTTPPTPTALTALRNVAEDCVDSDFNARLPTNRRTDILRQLNMELPEVLPRLFQVMARTYEGEWRRSLCATQPPPRPFAPRATHTHTRTCTAPQAGKRTQRRRQRC